MALAVGVKPEIPPGKTLVLTGLRLVLHDAPHVLDKHPVAQGLDRLEDKPPSADHAGIISVLVDLHDVVGDEARTENPGIAAIVGDGDVVRKRWELADHHRISVLKIDLGNMAEVKFRRIQDAGDVVDVDCGGEFQTLPHLLDLSCRR